MSVSSIKRKLPLSRLLHIRLLALDFDGTLTDGTVYVSEDGTEMVRCSRRDSLGIEMLKNAGVIVFVISKEKNKVVSARCKKMKIACFQAVKTGEDKCKILEMVAKKHGFPRKQIGYMGDDVNDVPALRCAGMGVTVADGHKKAKEAAHYITNARGGEHAVREICDLILAAKEMQPRF